MTATSNGNGDKPARLRRWKMLREEWESLDLSETLTTKNGTKALLPSEHGVALSILSQGGRAQRGKPQSDLGDLHEAYEAMSKGMKFAVRMALSYAEKRGVDLTELAEYTRSFDLFIKESDELHAMLEEDRKEEAKRREHIHELYKLHHPNRNGR
jgi:hypothetical protein